MRRDAHAVAVFVGLVLVLCLLAVVWPWPAQAHNARMASSPHAWLRDKVLGRTEAKPVHPVEPCTKEIEGDFVLIYDPILKVWVQWVCRCPDDGHGCRWYRAAWYPEKPYVPGGVVLKAKAKDTHRSCKAIVCLRHRHVHTWNFLVLAESPIHKALR